MTREEAIEIIKRNCIPGRPLREACEMLIPELAESENERNEKIRKQLISSFDYEMSKYGNVEWEKGISYREVIVWLEKQKEQKPNDIRTWQKIVDKVLTDYNGIGQYLDDGICKQIAEDLREKYCFGDKSSDWENVYRNGVNYGKAQAMKEMKEQKPEWNEEDEENIQSICARLDSLLYTEDVVEKTNIVGEISWLKSLRPPFKDKEMKLKILKYLSTRCSALEYEEVEEYLNNLRPSWKPSEEQMEALKSAVKLYKDTHFEIFHEKIVSLYEQLKKLM